LPSCLPPSSTFLSSSSSSSFLLSFPCPAVSFQRLSR
jgi:hypothetical protein